MTDRADGAGWQYLGVGCVTGLGGFFGGGMIAILAAKIVGAVTGCAADQSTGAPCNWFWYALCGAIGGLILLPTYAVGRLWRGRRQSDNSERG